MFDVNQFIFRIGDPFDFFCIGVVLATIVDLQLYPKILIAFSIKDGFRFVVVIVDHAMVCVAAVAAVITAGIASLEELAIHLFSKEYHPNRSKIWECTRE